jgi:hypothetical protein
VAERITARLREKYSGALQAIGAHGSLAHGDDMASSTVEIVAVTRSPRCRLSAGTRRIDGLIVDLAVIGADEYLKHARTITTSWPLVADQYLTTRPLHDPDAWFPRLRDTHISRLAHAQSHVFASLAREAWCRAKTAQTKARQMAESYETDAAMLVLGEARLGVAVVDGLLTRTYFRTTADAVRRAGVATAHIYELGERLEAQAIELAKRGRPVDTDIEDLL